MNRAVQIRTFWTALIILSAISNADFGPCRYDEDRCSCKLGEANQGICWDKIQNQPGLCTRRFCKAGWTCACGGRTHVCYRSAKNVNVVKDSADASKQVADCETKPRSLVSEREITLGTFKIHLSRNGMLVNDCAQVAWWHNGELLGNRNVVNGMSESNVDAELRAREDHSLLELRPGDLLAFRIREGSYYCYKHFSEMVVNTVDMDTAMPTVTTHYAREYSKDWFMPSFKLTPENTAETEAETDLKKFLPIRKHRLTDGAIIENGKDYWQPRDDNSADNKRSNWYYRIQIPGTPATRA